MLVVLSQKVDSASDYLDELFIIYHYPARYRTQVQAGDVFVYYQGNRYDKNQRYYFGTGTVAEISTNDNQNYFARLSECKQFEHKVPIYLPDGGYIEQLDYQDVRKKITPPWQSSVRPLSRKAFEYIIRYSGIKSDIITSCSLEEMKEQLKKATRSFYIDNNPLAIKEIIKRAEDISNALQITISEPRYIEKQINTGPGSTKDIYDDFAIYCKTMKMSYSYKPLLILALFSSHDDKWSISSNEAARYFKDYYYMRRINRLAVEKKPCIYHNARVTLKRVKDNIITNPVKSLVASGFFEFDVKNDSFVLSSSIVEIMDNQRTLEIIRICKDRLNQYYSCE